MEDEGDRFSREVQPVLDFLKSGSSTEVVRIDTTGAAPNSWGPVNDQLQALAPELAAVLTGRSS